MAFANRRSYDSMLAVVSALFRAWAEKHLQINSRGSEEKTERKYSFSATPTPAPMSVQIYAILQAAQEELPDNVTLPAQPHPYSEALPHVGAHNLSLSRRAGCPGVLSSTPGPMRWPVMFETALKGDAMKFLGMLVVYALRYSHFYMDGKSLSMAISLSPTGRQRASETPSIALCVSM